MKPILVGIDNPHSNDPRHALAPYPENSSGWRLWMMLHDWCGMSRGEYMKAFDRRNLNPQKFQKLASTTVLNFACTYAMARILGSLGSGSRVVLIGDEVRRSIPYLKKQIVHPQVVEDMRSTRGIIFYQIPHPSGRNLIYNDPTMRNLIALLLKDLADGK